MIAKTELLELARFSHFKPHQQEKHYIQSIILNSIYSTVTDVMVFKGGTCLLFFYNLPRFSEDLDFTMVKEFDEKKLISNLKKDLQNLGINANFSKLEETPSTISFKIGVEGPLFTREIERCFVRIEISKREEVFFPKILEFKTNYNSLIGFNMNVMSEKEILAEKVRAILTRNKARDLFDLHFLLKKHIKPDHALINKKMDYYKKSFNIKEFKGSVEKKKGIWTQELKPFILGDIPDFDHVEELMLKEFRNL